MPARIAFACLVVCSVAAGTAAAGEGEKAFSVGTNFATFTVSQGDEGDSATAVGGTLSLDMAYGITDSIWLRGGVSGGPYAAGGLAWSAGGTVGIMYAFDVVKYVPYAELGLGAMYVDGGDVEGAAKLLVELGGGLDVLRSPSFSFGINVRFASFASGITNFTFGPRLTWRWGYF